MASTTLSQLNVGEDSDSTVATIFVCEGHVINFVLCTQKIGVVSYVEAVALGGPPHPA